MTAAVLCIKASQLQIFDSTYREKARATVLDKQILYPSRGLIYDRNDQLLVLNNPMYDLKVTYSQIDPDMDVELFCKLLDISKVEFEQNLDKDWSKPQYSKAHPFPFLKKISAQKYATFQEYLHRFPGFEVQLRNARAYPHQNAAHILGYISEVDQKEIESSEGNYVLGDYIGTSGVELVYENGLKGNKGHRLILKDNLGRIVSSFDNGSMDSLAVSGRDINLSIDLALQQYGEQLMQNKKGGVVVIEPQSGEILAMVSSPGYDPNKLTIHPERGNAFKELERDSLNPFFNRAIMAKYPPGSLIKPVYSLIGLQEGLIDPNKYMTCTGGYTYKSAYWRCHAGPGRHNLRQAIQHSCNTYFYLAYRDLIDQFGFHYPEKGLDKLNDYLHQFGLGEPLGVDIPSEGKGLIPSVEFYDEMYEKEGDWRSTYIISNAIGQGEVEFTTVQMANLAATIANKGFYYVPHFLKSYYKSEDAIPIEFRTAKRVPIDKEHFQPVIEGMEAAIARGTAGLAMINDIAICGKTGTSENPHGEDHSVFFGFAPKENPKIAIAVYIENAGWGGAYAAPISSLMIEKYLTDSIRVSRKWIEKRMMEANLIKQP